MTAQTSAAATPSDRHATGLTPSVRLAAAALDPDSDAGRRTADVISDFEADVISRLQREGKPVPPIPHSQ